MKKAIQISTVASILFVGLSFLTSSCKKDNDTPDTPNPAVQLVGTWDATSVKENGMETLVPGLFSLSMNYEAMVGNVGKYSWTATVLGAPAEIPGTYSISSDGKQMTMDGNQNFNVLLLNSTNLTISADTVVIEAKRR